MNGLRWRPGRVAARLRRTRALARRLSAAQGPAPALVDLLMLERAMRLARRAAAEGEVPVAAVVYRGREVLAEAHNRREFHADPTGHAEILALRAAGRALGAWRLAGCSLAVTLEPCAMCAGALVNARVQRLIYGARDPKAGACESLYEIATDRRLNHRLEVARGVYDRQCAALLTRFFQARRGALRGSARRSAPPSLVCFDLGGVVVRICRSWEEGCARAGIALRGADRLAASAAARRVAVEEYQTGRIDADAFAARLSAALGGLYGPEEVMQIHRAWTIDEYPGIGAAIRRLHRAGVATAALSNTNDAHWSAIRRWPAVQAIQHPCVSHEMGLHKPDLAIYREFERRVGRRGAEILFFDDLPENTEAARRAGWTAVTIDHAGDTAAQVIAAAAAAGIGV